MTPRKTPPSKVGSPQITPRQERFAREYLRTGNAKRSALLAGYSGRSAKQIGFTLLQNSAVRQAIEALRSAAGAAGPDLSPEWALRRLVEEIADPNPRVRLDAKKAVVQALGPIRRESGGSGACPTCEPQRELGKMSVADLTLRLAGVTRERLMAMSPPEFEAWERRLRTDVEGWVLLCRQIRERQGKEAV
jgi:NAD(P)-dependent dehydrogenase (short-subunit alcohol dehydrogenase family)